MDAEHLTVNIVTFVSIALTLVLATRKITEASTRIQLSTEANQKTNEQTEKRMAAVIAALEQIPLLAQRMGQVEEDQLELRRKVFSDFPSKIGEVVARVITLEEKARSMDKFKAVRFGNTPDTDK